LLLPGQSFVNGFPGKLSPFPALHPAYYPAYSGNAGLSAGVGSQFRPLRRLFLLGFYYSFFRLEYWVFYTLSVRFHAAFTLPVSGS
jgi:hypothetical protein